MRLVLPTGVDGADREYPLDDIANLSRLTLNETIDLKRVTGMDLSKMIAGFGFLDSIIGVPSDGVLQAMSEHLPLMEAYRALVWLARYRSGERRADGALLTVEEAVDFPFVGLNVRSDPGDEPPEDGVNPRRPTEAGDPATVGRTAKAATRGRSQKTSAKKS